MKFRTVNGKIRHAVSPIGQARAETKACGGCGYHVCSCVKVSRAVEASPGAMVPCGRNVGWGVGSVVQFAGGRVAGFSGAGGGGGGAGGDGNEVRIVTTGSVTAGGGGVGGTGGDGGNGPSPGFERQIGKYIFRMDPATGHVFWRHADDA